MIDKISLKNFTVFEDVEIDFTPRVNVIVGQNGTGKTHLLKAAYAICSGNNSYVGQDAKISSEQIRDELTKKFLRVFRPTENKIGRLKRHDAKAGAEIGVSLFGEKTFQVNFNTNSKYVAINENDRYQSYSWEPVFIPTKEILSFVNAINADSSDQATIEALFNDAYLDLCRKMGLPAKRLGRDALEDPRIGTLIIAISKAIGGKFGRSASGMKFQAGEFKSNPIDPSKKAVADDEGSDDAATDTEPLIISDTVETKFAPREDGFETSAQMTAEGFRKLGLLQHLLENKTLIPGVSGPLFWDEPEANMNPSLMRTLVEVILELSRNGQQVILASHDYVLLKWFDLLRSDAKEDHVRFHVLHRGEDSDEVFVESTDDYLAISPNAIADTFDELTKEQVTQKLKGLGK